MSRGRLAVGAAFVAGLGALVAVGILLRGGGTTSDSTAPEQAPAIEARGVVTPQNVLFGDSVTAQLEVTVDPSRVDPGSVQVAADFTPWTAVADPVRSRRDAQGTTSLRTTYLLRCLDASCLSPSSNADQTFPVARVTYTTRSGAGTARQGSLRVDWPGLTVASRYLSSGQGAGSSAPWRADLLSPPAVSYRFSPGMLIAVLLSAALALLVAGGTLVYRLVPRRGPPLLPAADATPAVVLTPLEWALALLEDPARVNGAGDQRRALEFVAAELAAHGDARLAQTARALAWSEAVPAVESTRTVAGSARSVLAEDLAATEELHADLA